ncbi:glycine/betaine/sarcosine/D-proline family reductase selenoprotein B [Treponema sp. OMZ 788]|uniref:glycine/betaine/sarcosine/D-proline family reductase selenoprotein B n=1 Tax=Treponema sp. OMZ 788 TaxID=2563664 RepID=UPI0020A48AD2|nr:glycine/betaine/sarcosine/D-proline family reductase selenoprotein B [Treponema sp. OMZ 788]UTC64976.1 glycine/betaine/sarcosine/D-proline family reductase selenoprotein B [Treponema sp. OMZ 788]
MSKIIVHYVNQFFAGKGGEDMTDYKIEVIDGAIGPGIGIQTAIGNTGKIIKTIICGDNYFTKNENECLEFVENIFTNINPDIFIAGPSFNSMSYGLACGKISKLAYKMKIPAIGGLYEVNPSYDEFNNFMQIVKTGNTAASMRYAIPAIADRVKDILSNKCVIVQNGNAEKNSEFDEFCDLWKNELDAHLNEIFDILSNAYNTFNDSLFAKDTVKAYAALEIFTDGSFIKKISKKLKVIEEWYEQKYRDALILELKDSSLDKWLTNREANWLEDALQNDINEVLVALEALKEPAKNFIKDCVGSDIELFLRGSVKGISAGVKKITSNSSTGWIDGIAEGVLGLFGNDTEYDEIEAKFTASMNRIIETFDFINSINSIVVNKFTSEEAFQDGCEEDNLQIEYQNDLNESNDSGDVPSRLKKLKELFESGIIDEDEYKAKKKELIDLL